MSLILSPEQKALRLVHQLHSEEGQAQRFSAAIGRGINALNQDITVEGAKPSLQAVMNALANSMAFHLVMVDNPTLRMRVLADLVEELPHMVQDQVDAKAAAVQGRPV